MKISLRDEAGLLVSELERGLPASSQWISTNIHRDLGVDGVRGSLTIRSLDAAPLVAVCRHTQTFTRQDVFQQAFDLRGAAKVFCLPYRSEKDLHQSWIVLNNLESEPANVALRAFSPEGAALRDSSFQVPALGSILVPDSLFLASQGDRALFGIVRGTSNRSLSGLVIQTNLATRDTIHTNMVTAWSPEVLIPSVTETSTFSSNLLVSNLADTGTWVEISHRASNGQSPAPAVRALLPARGSVYLDKVLASLHVKESFGPLTLRSIEGQPLAAFSHVMNTENGARGALDWTDLRPSVSKRVGEQVTLHWQYDPAEARKIQEYRIYRADRAARNFQIIDRVPSNVLERSLEARDTGTFVISVRAFDGARESHPSNEVLLEVKP